MTTIYRHPIQYLTLNEDDTSDDDIVWFRLLGGYDIKDKPLASVLESEHQ